MICWNSIEDSNMDMASKAEEKSGKNSLPFWPSRRKQKNHFDPATFDRTSIQEPVLSNHLIKTKSNRE
jgi:hypothetical protein